jgi:hypothetical protein
MANDQEETGTSATEAQIAVHWREEEYFYPPARFIGQANASDPTIFDRFTEEHFPECFREYAELLDWDQDWHTTLDTSDPPFWKWFVGGHRPPFGDKGQQSRFHMGARARSRRNQDNHLP